jgi:hypothetical protein
MQDLTLQVAPETGDHAVGADRHSLAAEWMQQVGIPRSSREEVRCRRHKQDDRRTRVAEVET